MAERQRPVTKRADEILDDIFAGYQEAKMISQENGKRYLANYIDKYNSIPNPVKFFLYDLLAEAAYQADDHALCLTAVEQAEKYLPAAQEESRRRFDEYLPQIRCFERGISVHVDAGEFTEALELCDKASSLNLGRAYAAKRASIERML